jgi:hypothetical protein
MPAFSTLQLKNQAGTETSFSPTTIDPSTKVATWLGAGATLDARSQATHSVLLPTGKGTRVRIKQKVTVPVLDVDGVKVDELICNVEFSLPKNSALADRQNIRAYMADFLADPTVVAAIENFESVY